MTIYLKAIPQPGEVLRQGSTQRPNIRFNTPNEKICLGRNSRTMIADISVSRRECSLVMTNGSLLVDQVKTAIWVNGMPLGPGMQQDLAHGDKISLPDGRYGYEVVNGVGDADTADASTPKAAFDPPPLRLGDKPPSVGHALSGRKRSASQASATKVPDNAKAPVVLPANVLEEFYCAVCLDIQVQAATLVPCGHTFCESCCISTLECPSCRGSIDGRVPCRSINNIIADLVAEPSPPFPADDAEVYRERMQKYKGKTRAVSRKSKRARLGNTPAEAICID